MSFLERLPFKEKNMISVFTFLVTGVRHTLTFLYSVKYKNATHTIFHYSDEHIYPNKKLQLLHVWDAQTWRDKYKKPFKKYCWYLEKCT